MKLFKNIKRKVGNAILPVVGTILGLTILAGTVVGVALNSTKLIYRENKLQQQNDARQIIYLAAKYFCKGLNEGKEPATLRQELQDIFGPGLKVTRDTNDTEKFYIWYPNKYVTGNEYTTDENVAEWLKATIKKTEVDDDGGDHGDSGINNTLFSQEAKIDEKFAIGNMMTVYLTDEHLLPGRRYSINEVSLVESDIDTFDEAFTYMNNTGVLEIDDIVVALYKYGVLNNGTVSYIETKESATQPYTIVYKTGNLGGNYYWQYNGTDYETWLYRQEYDIDLLYDMLVYYYKYYENSTFTVSKSNLKYSYNDGNDSHRIYSTRSSDDFDITYSSSQRFAETLADYIFWKNLPRLCMNIKEFETKIYSLVDASLKQRKGNSINIWQHTFEWKDEGLTVYPYWTDSQGRWYTEYDYTVDQIANIFVNNLTGYSTNGALDFDKLYAKLSSAYSQELREEVIFQYVSKNEVINYYKRDQNNRNEIINNWKDYDDTTQKTAEMLTLYQLQTTNSGNNKKLTNSYYEESLSFSDWKYYYDYYDMDYDYFYTPTSGDSVRTFNPNFYSASTSKSFDYTVSVGNNEISREIIDYINKAFYKKYVTEGKTMMSSDLQSGYAFEGFAAGEDEKMICTPELNFSGNNIKISFHFNVIVKKIQTTVQFKGNGIGAKNRNYAEKYEYEVKNWYSDNSGDSITLTLDQFLNEFSVGILLLYAENHLSQEQQAIINHYINENVETLTRDHLKSLLVNPIRYQYMPTSKMNSIIGNNSNPGLKELPITNKLVTYYLEHGNDAMKTEIGDNDYQIDIISSSYDGSTLSSDYDDYLEYVVNFKVSVDTNGDKDYSDVVYNRTISFILQYMTYSAQNNAKYNATTFSYDDVLNNNVTASTDNDGTIKNIFRAVAIQNSNTDLLSTSDITGNNIPTILSNIPYTERINSNQVPYKDHKITIDGDDYTVTNSLSDIYNVTENTLYNGSINDLAASNSTITVANGKSLFINGDLRLKDSQKIILGNDSLLFVNGNMQIEYNYKVEMRKTRESNGWYYTNVYHTRELLDADYNTFVNSGVDVKAGVDAKIMVNGNFDYRGFKAKYAYSSSGFTINHVDGTQEKTKLDTIYEQYVLNNNFVSSEACELDEETGKWTHYGKECRGQLEGIYIINGDVTFHAWDEKNTTDNSVDQNVAMYRNMYSNPKINGTFYVDGTFDMKGLYTSGLYDQCRANFVFAKSIVEPYVALNTVLCAGRNSNYGAWSDSDGYLFMICEEAIDFSKVNFACVNLFTPFQELINAINANKQSETNFSEFISRDVFTGMYPNSEVIDEWGLPSILRSGFSQLYVPGDIGAITAEEHRYGTEV